MTRVEALTHLSVAATITFQDGEMRAYNCIWDCIVSLAPEKSIGIIKLYAESMEHCGQVFSNPQLRQHLTDQSENFGYIERVCFWCVLILKEVEK